MVIKSPVFKKEISKYKRCLFPKSARSKAAFSKKGIIPKGCKKLAFCRNRK